MSTTSRVVHDKNYTVISNNTIQDKRLSCKATGLLCLLLSYPDGWEVNLDHMADQKRDGKDSIKSAISELKQFGYIVRRRVFGEDGRISWESEIHEIPPEGDPTIEGFSTSGKSTHGQNFDSGGVPSTSGKTTSGKSTDGISTSGKSSEWKSDRIISNKESNTDSSSTKDPDPILSVQQAETDPVATGGKKGKAKGVNNRNKSDIYAKLKNPESFESFWDWYQTKLDNIPPDREGKRVKAGSKNKAAEAWKACIEDGNKLDLFREGCRKFDFMGTRGVPHAERFIRNEIYLNGISNGSGADFVALTGSNVTEEDRENWIEEMRKKGQKFYRGPGGVIDQERAEFFHQHAYIFEEVAS